MILFGGGGIPAMDLGDGITFPHTQKYDLIVKLKGKKTCQVLAQFFLMEMPAKDQKPSRWTIFEMGWEEVIP